MIHGERVISIYTCRVPPLGLHVAGWNWNKLNVLMIKWWSNFNLYLAPKILQWGTLARAYIWGESLFEILAIKKSIAFIGERVISFYTWLKPYINIHNHFLRLWESNFNLYLTETLFLLFLILQNMWESNFNLYLTETWYNSGHNLMVIWESNADCISVISLHIRINSYCIGIISRRFSKLILVWYYFSLYLTETSLIGRCQIFFVCEKVISIYTWLKRKRFI